MALFLSVSGISPANLIKFQITMKYLQTFGFQPDNTIFRDHSWYFRNALVRANYNEFYKAISVTDEYLARFLRICFLEKTISSVTARCTYQIFKVSLQSLRMILWIVLWKKWLF